MNRFPVGVEVLTSTVHPPGYWKHWQEHHMPLSALSCVWGYPGDPWGENAKGMRGHSNTISPWEPQLCMPVGEGHTVNGTSLPLSSAVTLSPALKLCTSAFLLSSLTHMDPMVLGHFGNGNLQRSFVTHHLHPPPPFLKRANLIYFFGFQRLTLCLRDIL